MIIFCPGCGHLLRFLRLHGEIIASWCHWCGDGDDEDEGPSYWLGDDDGIELQ